MPTEFSIGEVVGWRCWRKMHNDGKLRSAFVGNADWSGGAVIGGAPVTRIVAGVHAWKTLRQAKWYARDVAIWPRSGRRPPFDVVIGKVLLWGDIIEHKKGYRAQYGRVEQITHRLSYTGEWLLGYAVSKIEDVRPLPAPAVYRAFWWVQSKLKRK